ncbi:MAG: hypothetical protein VKI63_05255 [Cyanobium sp.]|nr:hypothetical protein [Cyanobium sp.]
MKQIYLWPSQASPQVEPVRLDAIAAELRQRRLPAVFCESTFDDRQQRQLAQQAGARFATPIPSRAWMVWLRATSSFSATTPI